RRWAARRILPRPGEGPSAEARARGFFRSRLVGRVDGIAEPVVLRLACDLDPGYGATALMLREAALSLALDDLGDQGGVLTPAAAFGERLVARLRRVGLSFDLDAG
ncbi:MAG: saccharopine dehydrogenase, partial [Trueperaceae bacterium]